MTPPNILYIHSHDTGRYVQPYGHQVPTPNIQMLADQGAFFRQAFCASPTCSGSRASLLTGQYCHSNGMFGLAHRGWSLNDYEHHLVHPLRSAGYSSAMIGEQHIASDPAVIGYDEVIDVDSNHVADVAPTANETLRPTRGAVLPLGRLLRDAPGVPGADLGPRHALLAAGSQPPRHGRRRARTWPRSRRAPAHSTRGSARCSTSCTGSGSPNAPLIVCTTDHGLAFPRAKATLFDRGTGVMLLMRGPGGFSGGKVIDSMVSHLDVYPTLCELAGVEPPGFLQGTSLLPLIRGRGPGDPRGAVHRDDLPRRLRAAARGPDGALEVRPALPRLRVPGARQLRRQLDQGAADRGRMGRPARARGAALRPPPRSEREPRASPTCPSVRRRSPTCASGSSAGWWTPTTRCGTARSSRRRERS